MNRYKTRRKAINNNQQYENIFEDRDVKQIEQYRTEQLQYPSENEINDLELVKYYWSPGDTYYKVANKFYGDHTYWWVLAQFNKIPFEGDLKVGNVIFIPLSLIHI